MRSRSVRWGELFIFIGVLVLALQYIDWKAFAPIERAGLGHRWRDCALNMLCAGAVVALAARG
jgi:hypothetical protein